MVIVLLLTNSEYSTLRPGQPAARPPSDPCHPGTGAPSQ